MRHDIYCRILVPYFCLPITPIFKNNVAAFEAPRANGTLDSQLEEELDKLDGEMIRSESPFIKKYKATIHRATLNPFF